jgi:hypothetical protein
MRTDVVRPETHTYPNPDSLLGKYKRTEADIQAEREASIIGATYFSVNEIPPSPREPPAGASGAEKGDNAEAPRVMTLGSKVLSDPEVQGAIDWVHSPTQQRTSLPVASNAGVTLLLEQMAASSAGQVHPTPSMMMPPPPSMPAGPVNALSGVDLGSLLASLQNTTQAVPSYQPPVSQQQPVVRLF